MNALRVSVTLLESFRMWASGDWMPESDLIDSIKGLTVATPKMLLGTSGHCALENREPDHLVDGWHACHGFRWSPDTVSQIRPHYPTGGISEIKGTVDFNILGRTVTLSGKGDHFIGAEQREAKFTLSDFDPDKYADSLQWRSYALIFNPSAVEYAIFCCALDDDTQEVTVKSVHPLRLYPYAGVGADVTEWLVRFVEYVTLRGLEPYLRPRIAA